MNTLALLSCVSLSAIAVLAGCASHQIIQPGALGRPQAAVAIIQGGKNEWAKPYVMLKRVIDENGQDVATFGVTRYGAEDSVVLTPGRYEVHIECQFMDLAAGSPSAKITVQAGITYTFTCRLYDLVAYPEITQRAH